MQDDKVSSSENEESTDSFIRRKMRQERDFAAEALARKQLVDRLVGQRPTKQQVELRPSSVIQAPKKHIAKGAGTKSTKRAVGKRPLQVIEKQESAGATAVAEPKVLKPEITKKTHVDKEPQVAKIRVEEKPSKRTTSKQKFSAAKEVAEAHGDPRQLLVRELLKETAGHIDTTFSAMRTFYNRQLSTKQKNFLLYGKHGRKVTRSEEKFVILMRLREEMRQEGLPAPRKKELVAAAIKPLGMTPFSTATYIYERLTPRQCKALDLRPEMTVKQQIGILKEVREEMANKGLPPPRQIDLAEAAAARLGMKVDSARAFISDLSWKVKNELDLLQSRSGRLKGLDPTLIREGFLGAFAVLKVRRLPATMDNLRLVLRLKSDVIKSYLDHSPDIKAIVTKARKK